MLDVVFAKPISPIFVVGDSNTLLYRFQTVDLPDVFARPLVTLARFIPGLSAETILKDRELNPKILDIFAREFIIERTDRWRLYGERGAEAQAVSRTITPPLHDIYNFDGAPPVLLMLGALDLGFILRTIGPSVDFFLEDPYFVESAFDGPSLPSIAYRAVLHLIEERLEPIGAALRLLGDIGFAELYLHNVLPPTPDDVRYFRLRHTMCSAKIRYKVAIVMNHVLARLARANGARFLDMWPQTVVDGIVDPRLVVDGDHVNREAIEPTLRALLGDILHHRGIPVHAPTTNSIVASDG